MGVMETNMLSPIKKITNYFSLYITNWIFINIQGLKGDLGPPGPPGLVSYIDESDDKYIYVPGPPGPPGPEVGVLVSYDTY